MENEKHGKLEIYDIVKNLETVGWKKLYPSPFNEKGEIVCKLKKGNSLIRISENYSGDIKN